MQGSRHELLANPQSSVAILAQESGRRAVGPPQMAVSHTISYFHWQKGESRSGLETIKVVVFTQPERDGGPTVFVQMREIIDRLKLAASHPWHRWIAKDGWPRDVEDFFVFVGADGMDWRPSAKSGRAKGLAEERMMWLLSEYMASLNVVLGLLADWACRLRGVHRKQALAILQDLAMKVIGCIGPYVPDDIWKPPAASEVGCEDKPDQPEGAMCGHCSKLLGRAAVRDGRCSIPDLVGMMVDIMRTRKRSHCIELWGGLLFPAISALFARCCDGDLNRSPVEMSSFSLRGAYRRRRLDPNILNKAAQDLVRSGKFPSVSAAARAGVVDASRPSAQDSEEENMRRYLKSCWDAVEGQRQASLAFDESTLGGEGTMFGALWLRKRHIGFWGVPQATPEHVWLGI